MEAATRGERLLSDMVMTAQAIDGSSRVERSACELI
jgi:hypothetical protein